MNRKKIISCSVALLSVFAILLGNMAKAAAWTGEGLPDNICTTADGQPFENMTDAGISITYNGSKINTNQTPVVHYQGVYMMALRQTVCRKGPKASFEHTERTGHIRLVFQNHVVTFYVNEKTMYADGQKYKLAAAPVEVVYTRSAKNDILVPAEQICAALGLACQWKTQDKTLALKKKKVSFPGKSKKTRYPYSAKKYAKLQYKRMPKVSYKKYLSYIQTKKDTTSGFKYLRVDCYRDVDKKKFKQYYQYLIRDYCREAKLSVRKSSLYNKAEVFLKAAKKYNLDPVYLVSQTFLESAYGTSLLARGNKIKKVAYRGYPRTKSGKFKTRKLKKKCKVYNLYGIKAYDKDPFVGGTSYAYYHKWTTVRRAIYGAAAYLSSQYIRGRYAQNTLFKMRFSPVKSGLWHQYATAPHYAEAIGERMYLMSTCYQDGVKFLYDYPKFR